MTQSHRPARLATPGGVISLRWAASNQYAWAASSEPGHFLRWMIFLVVVGFGKILRGAPSVEAGGGGRKGAFLASNIAPYAIQL